MSAGTVQRLVGVYDADHTIRGEISYAIGHLLGRRTCDLCTITHRGVRKKSAFTALADGLDIPFDLIHRDEQTPEMRALTDGRLACVVADVDGELMILLDADHLAACQGAPDALFAAVDRAMTDRDLASA